MKPIQLEIKGFERTEKPEPKNMNDKAKNIFIGKGRKESTVIVELEPDDLLTFRTKKLYPDFY